MKVKSDYIIEAIWKLRPNSQFSFTNEDYSTIEWHVLEGKAPTNAEIDEAIELIKQEEKNAAEALLLKKAAVEAKLTALGLTADDLKVLGLG